MDKNMKYIIENMKNDKIPARDWLNSIKIFFGKDQLELFCEYFININNIIRSNDIRNLIDNISMSAFSTIKKEQIAIVSINKLIDSRSILINTTKNGFEKAQQKNREKNIELSKEIKKLGYSYTGILANWQDRYDKNTYQKEYIFMVYSENDNKEQFRKKIGDLIQKYNLRLAFISESIPNNNAKLQIVTRIIDVKRNIIVKKFEDTTIESIEKYLSKISQNKVVLKIPDESNKKILYMEEPKIDDYYSKEKQEIIRAKIPDTFNMGMVKQKLIYKFEEENYNN